MNEDEVEYLNEKLSDRFTTKSGPVLSYRAGTLIVKDMPKIPKAGPLHFNDLPNEIRACTSIHGHDWRPAGMDILGFPQSICKRRRCGARIRTSMTAATGTDGTRP